MTNDHTEEAELEMADAVETLAARLSTIRTGKASPVMLDSVRVDYYGTLTPLKQLANVGVPEPRLLTVVPFSSSLFKLGSLSTSKCVGLRPTPPNLHCSTYTFCIYLVRSSWLTCGVLQILAALSRVDCDATQFGSAGCSNTAKPPCVG